MGAGVNVLTARFIGARERENTRQTVHTASAVCLGLGVILFALCFCLARPLLTLLGTKEELIDGAILYMRIYAFGLPAMALYNFGSAVLTASGDTKRPLIFLSIAGGLNICLNLFFVIVCKMAADGVALATILSQYTSAVLVLRVLLRTQEDYRLELKNFVFSWEKAQRILALGITSGLQHAIFAMANLFIQSAVNTFSAAVVEGNSAAANADSLVYEVMAAPYTACSTFISQNYGCAQQRAHPKGLPRESGVFVRRGRSAGAGAHVLRRRLPAHFHAGPRGHCRGHGKASYHGLELCVLGVHGQLACRFAWGSARARCRSRL